MAADIAVSGLLKGLISEGLSLPDWMEADRSSDPSVGQRAVGWMLGLLGMALLTDVPGSATSNTTGVGP